eukprot:evm.model.scf_279.3 EVM.evm.TU.scf_279.3   scf_279:17908-19530(+)
MSLETCFSGRAVTPSSRTATFSCPAQKLQAPANGARVVMRKKDIHPEYYDDAKVYCKGEHVVTVCGTQPEYSVDIWSGNHPFFLGQMSAVVTDDSRVNKFAKKYAGMDFLVSAGSEDEKKGKEGKGE